MEKIRKDNIQTKESKTSGFNFQSIKIKLIIYFSILVLLSSVIIGTVSVLYGSNALTKGTEDSISTLAYEGAKLTKSRIDYQKRTFEMISLRTDIQSMDWGRQQPILKELLNRVNLLDLGVAQLDGTTYYTDGSTVELGDREYMKKALNGEINVSDLLISRATGEVVLMYAAPIERDGKIVGALIGRRDGNALSEIVEDIGLGNQGYAYMLNKDGTIVAHPDRDKVLNQFSPIEEAKDDNSLKSLGTLFGKILSQKIGIDEYSFEGKELYAAYAPIEDSDWIIVITAPKGEALSAIPTMRNNIIIIAGVVLLISMVITYLVSNAIANPIIESVRHAEKIANLDISADVPEKFLNRGDEIGVLGRAFQSITDNLRAIIMK